MAKRRGGPGRSPLDPDDVLAGRVKPAADELLDLIHRINPTGRDLSAREAELRYAQKSRLQSLLVRRFAAELSVVPDPDREGTVSLRHSGHGRDGCHAVIAALDEDARAWVQLQVDLGAHLPAAPAAPAARPSGRGLPLPEAEDEETDDASPEALLRQAEEAALAYDYERARQDLTRAVAMSRGAKGPAAALLELLVETLGDDAEALAFEATLPAATLADPRVRAPLALAAARSGDEARALSLVRGSADLEAAAVFAALASAALAEGDAKRAAGHLEQAKKRAPAHPTLEGLAGEIARARALSREPAEAELKALAVAGREEEIERKAVEVLAQWPESAAARRALREIEERRRRGEAERLAAEAERERESAALEQARREEERVERVGRLLGAPDPKAGLFAYLELDDALRARVRARVARDVLRWVDLTGRGAPRARVEAALALERSRERAAADPEAALAWLSPHLGALERVPEARQLAREAEARLAERRAARALAEVRAARAALSAGSAAEALSRLSEVTLRELPEEARAEATALRAEAALSAARAERIAEATRLRATGSPFEARARVEVLLADAEGEERARWASERAVIQRSIQLAFCVEVDDEPQPLGEMRVPSGRVALEEALRWLADEGRTIVLAEGHDHWVLVRSIDRASLTVRAAVILRTVDRIGNVEAEVRGRTLWLLGEHGTVLALAMDGWEVLLYRAASDVLALDERAGGLSLSMSNPLSGPRFLWVMAQGDGGATRVRVIDLDRRSPRELSDVLRVFDIIGADEPRVACLKEAAVVLHEARGAALANGRIALGARPKGIVLHPSGRGLVVVVQVAAPARDGWELAWIEISPDGAASRPQPIEGSNGGLSAMIATDRRAGLLFVRFWNLDSNWELLTLRAGEDALTPLYRAPLNSPALLLQDDAAQGVVAFQSSAGGVDFSLLGPAPPEILARSPAALPWIPGVLNPGDCLQRTSKRAAVVRNLEAEIDGKSPTALGRWVHQHQRKAADPATLAEMALMLEGLGAAGRAEAVRLRAWLWERWPNNIHVRLLRADELARDGRWLDVQGVLAGFERSSFGDDQEHARHFCHLVALASLRAGDVERAREMMEEARTLEGPCKLEALAELLRPLPDPLSPEAWGPSLPPLVQIVGRGYGITSIAERPRHRPATFPPRSMAIFHAMPAVARPRTPNMLEPRQIHRKTGRQEGQIEKSSRPSRLPVQILRGKPT